MKNIIAIISTVIVFALMLFTFNNGSAFQGGEAGNIIEDLKTLDKKVQSQSQPKENDIEQEKLKALRDKAGNSASFAVSNDYRSKCASCHGVDGSGMQNGKKTYGTSCYWSK